MSIKNIQKIFLAFGILLFIVGIKGADKLSSTNFDAALIIGIVSCVIGFFCILAGMATIADKSHVKSEKDISEGEAPISIYDCTHVNGLVQFSGEGELRIFVDRLEFSVGGTQYTLPIERIISADILTQKQTEYIITQKLSHAVLGGLVFGDVGALIGGMPKSKAIETTEENLVITYEKDEEAKFIVLKNLPCEKVIRTIKQYVHLKPQHVDL